MKHCSLFLPFPTGFDADFHDRPQPDQHAGPSRCDTTATLWFTVHPPSRPLRRLLLTLTLPVTVSRESRGCQPLNINEWCVTVLRKRFSLSLTKAVILKHCALGLTSLWRDVLICIHRQLQSKNPGLHVFLIKELGKPSTIIPFELSIIAYFFFLMYK